MKPDQLRLMVENVLMFLLRAIVQFPEDLEVVRDFEGGSMTIWNLRCNGADRGRVIGKGGERFSALRAVTQLIGLRHGHQCKLGELMEAVRTADQPKMLKFVPNPNWPKDDVLALALDVGLAVFGRDTTVDLRADGHTAVVQFRPSQPMPAAQLPLAQLALDNLFTAVGNICGADIAVDIS